MEAFEAIRGRRSIRRFRPEPIATEVLEEMLEAARWAPYGTSVERRHFVVLGGQEKDAFLDFLAERIERLFPVLEEGSSKTVIGYARNLLPVLHTAPVLVLVYTEQSDAGPLLSISSGAAAIENLLLAAYERGIGSCWTTGAVYLADEIDGYLGIEDWMLLALVPLGYPDSSPPARERTADMVHWQGVAGEPNRVVEHEPPLPPGPIGDPEAPRVLLVDDSPEKLARCVRILQKEGLALWPLTDPTQAVEVFLQWKPQVVIVDAIMAGRSGHDLVDDLRRAAEGFVPIIVATTSYSAADEYHSLDHGADDVLAKPVEARLLAVRVRSALRAKQLYEQVEAVNEELRRLQKMQDDLTNMIVHDLRTPLTSILGSLQTLENSEYDPTLIQEFIPLSIESGKYLLSMINDLLDVSKLEAGLLELDPSDFGLQEVVEEVTQTLQPLAEGKGLTLSAEFPKGDIGINADRQAVKRIVQNLVGNSLKFTFKGGVTVRVERSEDGSQALIRVIDTGEGIAPDDQARIFEKFGQAESREQGKKLGTGLGLTFVKMAAEAHGGSVMLDSELGRGSTFTVALPLRAAE